ncbi:magnesium transporter [Candidatus Margulisiibacteriota bacterium]
MKWKHEDKLTLMVWFVRLCLMDLKNSEAIKKKKLSNLLERMIAYGTEKQYHLVFQKYHEADIADALEELSSEHRHRFFQTVKPEIAVEFLEEMEMPQQLELILQLKTELAAKFIEEMEPDDAADLIEELIEEDEEEAARIIDALPQEEAEDLKELLAYKEGSAGTIMTVDFMSIPENLTVREAMKNFKAQKPPDSEVSFYIFIVDENEKLVGFTTLRDLVMASLDVKVKDIRNDYPIKVAVDMDQEDVARNFQKYDLAVIPVVDDVDTLVGIITIDDVVDVVVEEATEDIYRLSGTAETGETQLISGRIIHSVRARIPWLILTIFGGMIASYVITIYSHNFRPKLFSLALSLSFVPLLMGLGGNVGNQSATIIVRGISTGLVKDDYSFKYIIRECAIGFLIGLIVAFFVFSFIFFQYKYFLFAFIVASSLLANITVASFIGSALPILLKKCRIDPAVASAPFISTALDIIGQIIYFTLTLYILTKFI